MNFAERCRQAVQEIHDPELGFSIIDLGLIYSMDCQEDTGCVRLTMTLTTPLCPLQNYFQTEITKCLLSSEGVKGVEVNFTTDPPWSASKAQLYIQEHFALMGIPLSR